MYKPLHLLVHPKISLAITLLWFSTTCLAEIRYSEIRSEELPPIIIDSFVFTETGHLELNVSHISISNHNLDPNSNLNLSQIGFLFAPMLASFDGRMFGLNHTQICYLQSDFVNIIYSLDSLEKNSKDFDLEWTRFNSSAIDLFFQNCLSPQIHISMDIRSAMYNLDSVSGERNYLSDGMGYSIGMYLLFMSLYLWLTVLGARRLLKMRSNLSKSVLRIHYILLLFMLFELLSFPIELLNVYGIQKIGYATDLVLTITSTPTLFSGVLVLALLGLIGSGWSIVKSKLQTMEKVVITLVIFLRIVYNILRLYKTIRSPCDLWCIQFQYGARILDCICIFCLLFLFGLTSRHLLRGGQVDGKARSTFRKIDYIFLPCVLASEIDSVILPIKAFGGMSALAFARRLRVLPGGRIVRSSADSVSTPRHSAGNHDENLCFVKDDQRAKDIAAKTTNRTETCRQMLEVALDKTMFGGRIPPEMMSEILIGKIYFLKKKPCFQHLLHAGQVDGKVRLTLG